MIFSISCRRSLACSGCFNVSSSRTWIRSLIVLFTASVALDLVPFGVVVASEGDAMVSPATIPERNKRCASLMIFTLMMVVTVKWLLSLVFASVLKRSRDDESVKRFQQGGKRG